VASEVHNGPALEDSSRSHHVRYDTSSMILQYQLLVTQARDICSTNLVSYFHTIMFSFLISLSTGGESS